MSKTLLPFIALMMLQNACTEIRSVFKSESSVSGSGGDGVAPALSIKLPNASRSVAVEGVGYAALGCSTPSTYNFCFTVMDSNGVRIREVGDAPKITLPSGGYVVATAIAYLAPSDVVIAGHTTGNLGEIQGGLGDGFVARYSLTGNRIWIKQFGQNTLGAANTNQREDFFDIAVDLTGNSYLAGRTRSHFGQTNAGNYDSLLMKLDPDGNVVWRKVAGSINDDEFRKVVITPQGKVIAGGTTCGNWFEENAGLTTEAGYSATKDCPTANFKDVVVNAYLADGTSIFNRQLGKVSLASGKGRGSDVLNDLAVGASGEVFITGSTTSSYGKSSDITGNNDTHAGMGDIFVSELSSTGVLQWSRMWGAAQLGTPKVDVGKKLLPLDDSGELLVCAETMGNLLEDQGGGAVLGGPTLQGRGDLVLIRMNQNGALISQSQLGNATIGPTRGGNKETCGSFLRSGSQFVLFGTSDGAFFPSGSGSAFLIRSALSDFTSIR